LNQTNCRLLLFRKTKRKNLETPKETRRKVNDSKRKGRNTLQTNLFKNTAPTKTRPKKKMAVRGTCTKGNKTKALRKDVEKPVITSGETRLENPRKGAKEKIKSGGWEGAGN